METINYLELKDSFETQLKDTLKFELLELHFAPYAFGSGMTAYRIKGRVFKIIYDGRDNLVEFMVSTSHEKYSLANWTTIFAGTPIEFLDKGVNELKNILKNTNI